MERKYSRQTFNINIESGIDIQAALSNKFIYSDIVLPKGKYKVVKIKQSCSASYSNVGVVSMIELSNNKVIKPIFRLQSKTGGFITNPVNINVALSDALAFGGSPGHLTFRECNFEFTPDELYVDDSPQVMQRFTCDNTFPLDATHVVSIDCSLFIVFERV